MIRYLIVSSCDQQESISCIWTEHTLILGLEPATCWGTPGRSSRCTPAAWSRMSWLHLWTTPKEHHYSWNHDYKTIFGHFLNLTYFTSQLLSLSVSKSHTNISESSSPVSTSLLISLGINDDDGLNCLGGLLVVRGVVVNAVLVVLNVVVVGWGLLVVALNTGAGLVSGVTLEQRPGYWSEHVLLPVHLEHASPLLYISPLMKLPLGP